jgi:hypothetical protein
MRVMLQHDDGHHGMRPFEEGMVESDAVVVPDTVWEEYEKFCAQAADWQLLLKKLLNGHHATQQPTGRI